MSVAVVNLQFGFRLTHYSRASQNQADGGETGSGVHGQRVPEFTSGARAHDGDASRENEHPQHRAARRPQHRTRPAEGTCTAATSATRSKGRNEFKIALKILGSQGMVSLRTI